MLTFLDPIALLSFNIQNVNSIATLPSEIKYIRGDPGNFSAEKGPKTTIDTEVL